MQDKKFKCDHEGCGKSFDLKISLMGHQRSHKKATPKTAEPKAEVSNPVPPLAPELQSADKKPVKTAVPMIQVMIQPVEGEPDDVFVRISGKETVNKSYSIKRGHWVTIPEQIAEILRNATVDSFKYVVDPERPGMTKRVPIRNTKYPMSERPVPIKV